MSFCPSAVAVAAASRGADSSSFGSPAPALVIVAGGGRELPWPLERVAAALSAHASGASVLQLLHGDARGADQLVAAAARERGWPVAAIAADWRRHGRLISRFCKHQANPPD